MTNNLRICSVADSTILSFFEAYSKNNPDIDFISERILRDLSDGVLVKAMIYSRIRSEEFRSLSVDMQRLKQQQYIKICRELNISKDNKDSYSIPDELVTKLLRSYYDKDEEKFKEYSEEIAEEFGIEDNFECQTMIYSLK